MTDDEIRDLLRSKWPLCDCDDYDIAKVRLGWEARGKRDAEVCRAEARNMIDSLHQDAAEQCALAIERGK